MSIVKLVLLLSGLECSLATFNYGEPSSSILIIEDPKGLWKSAIKSDFIFLKKKCDL